jgi:hypothetical protein
LNFHEGEKNGASFSLLCNWAAGVHRHWARQAKANYVYTFTSSFGTIQISNPELLANGSFNVPVTFLQGSGSLDFIEANQFDFVNGQTSTGNDFDEYAFVFFPFPDSPGDYSTVGKGFVSFRRRLGHDRRNAQYRERA